jgi:hypothetical protein
MCRTMAAQLGEAEFSRSKVGRPNVRGQKKVRWRCVRLDLANDERRRHALRRAIAAVNRSPWRCRCCDDY